ncbi:MAG: ATP-binding protein [Deltaproteobacteria bacterium]|nr:ATP-binding protein [Deltaproteobacteria bacterium]
MIEALRGLGYNTATALADIIDNSIAAKATTIKLDFYWSAENSCIRILDNGTGMDNFELDRAMRLGEINPLAERASGDLGRFGLGLKTASFSQCRKLSVASRKDNSIGCLRWDLDMLSKSKDDGWYLLEGIEKKSEKLFHDLNSIEHGTLVLWQLLDRIVSPGFTEQNFLNLIDRCEDHLAMVFHRFLEGANPQISILINGIQIKPWNPFLENRGSWSSPEVSIKTENGLVKVKGYVLPHRDKMDSKEFEYAGGPDGWTAQQGFYVYRNKRLLVAGSWLGLGQGRAWTKEESHRLARIRLDIPNSADAEWKLDIRKSTARPPVSIRPQLAQIADDVRARARKVYAHRGSYVAKGAGGPLIQAWQAEYNSGSMRYRIDRKHPSVKSLLEDAGALKLQIETMLKVIEETVPVQKIWLDTAEGKDVLRTGFSGDAPKEIMDVLDVIYRNLVLRKGMSPSLAKAQLLRTEPFQNFTDLVNSLPENLQN